MVEGKEFRELMLQVVRTRMAFRRSMQRTLKKNNAGITFEMLQILSCLWHEQGITQQVLAERTAKDKACLTNLMNNLEKKPHLLFYYNQFQQVSQSPLPMLQDVLSSLA